MAVTDMQIEVKPLNDRGCHRDTGVPRSREDSFDYILPYGKLINIHALGSYATYMMHM